MQSVRRVATLLAAIAAANVGCGGSIATAGAGADGDATIDATIDEAIDAPIDATAGADAGVVTVCGLPCTPRTCADSKNFSCAVQTFNDGCGGAITCPPTFVCGAGLTCCGGGCSATCPFDCVPISCHQLGLGSCGIMGDGCGAILDCGPCPGGEACVQGQCGPCPGDAGAADAH